jgi:intergrase/recombinase
VSSASLPVLSITGKTRKDLIKGLERDAEPLREISKYFRNLIKDIKIASFIEKSFIPPLKKVVSAPRGNKVNLWN